MDDIDYISDAMAIAVDPFKSFHQQKYHLLNMSNIDSDSIRHIGLLQTLFMIKYCVSLFDQKHLRGHIQNLAFSSSDWDASVIQLCVDICQVEGVSFSIPNWYDLLHVTYKSRQNDFFSSVKNDSVFKVKKRLIPLMDPLMSYSLYQPWETWFNKLYDLRR